MRPVCVILDKNEKRTGGARAAREKQVRMANELSLYIPLSFAISLTATLLLMPRLLRLCKRRGMYDIPDQRKVHHGNIPRLGGVLFIPCMLLATAATTVIRNGILHAENIMYNSSVLLVLTGMFLLYIIGVLDDLFGMRAWVKFCIQFTVSLFLPFCGLYIHNLYGLCGLYELPFWAAYPLTVFVSMLIVNAINLIDGIDGLASGLSLMALGAFCVLYYRIGVHLYSLYCAALAGTVSGFLCFNLFGKVERGTKTFMGDTGSLTLGYALAFLSIRYMMTAEGMSVSALYPSALLVPYTLLIVPCFDLGRVAFGRMLRKKSMFHPDKTHLHHRLLQAGFTMRQTLCVILLLQAAFCLLNWLLLRADLGVTYIVVADIALYAAFTGWLSLRIRSAKTTDK